MSNPSDQPTPQKDIPPLDRSKSPPDTAAEITSANKFFNDQANNSEVSNSLPRLELTPPTVKPSVIDNVRTSDEPALTPENFPGVAKTVLARISADLHADPKDGVRDDVLRFYVRDQRFTGQEAQALAAMVINSDDLMAWRYTDVPFLKPADLDKFQSDLEVNNKLIADPGVAANFKDDNVARLAASIAATTRAVAGNAQIEGTSYNIYGNQDPLKSINPDAVRQGETVNDAKFDAALAAVAKTHPELIRNSIKTYPNGLSTVRFPGTQSQSKMVANPSQTELGIFNHGSADGVWPSLMETAYGVRQLPEFMPGLTTRRYDTSLPQLWADKGDSPDILRLLTGHNANRINKSDTAQALQAAFSGPTAKAVVAETPQGRYFQQYTVMDFKPGSQGGGEVVLRDPRGSNSGHPGGRVVVPLAQFTKDYDITVEQ